MTEIIRLGLISIFSCLLIAGEANPNCPKLCRCIWQTLTVDCSNVSLHDLPQDIPEGTNHLNLSNNLLGVSINNRENETSGLNITQQYHTSWNKVSFSDLLNDTHNLTSLDLSSNFIDKIDILGQLHHLTSLRHLTISNNKIRQICHQKTYFNLSSKLYALDLRKNDVSDLTTQFFKYFSHLQMLWADRNSLRDFSLALSHSEETRHPLRFISLSHNLIKFIDPVTFRQFQELETLDLSYNRLTSISGIWSDQCSNMQTMSLSWNPISHISDGSFKACGNLTSLDISGLQNMSTLKSKSFDGLHNLKLLNLSHSSLTVIYPQTFLYMSNLKDLDISFNALQLMYDNTFQSGQNNMSINLGGNPWRCNCDMNWMKTWLLRDFHSVMPVICSSPYNLKNIALTDLSLKQLDCHSAQILNYTQTAYLKIGTSATLDCIVNGSPQPWVKWTTPQKRVFQYHPVLTEFPLGFPDMAKYHEKHHWHKQDTFFSEQDSNENRIHVLNNGSLFIDYVTRMDAGRYICLTENSYGNQSSVTFVTLDYLIIFDVTFWSISVGLICAGVFLLFGLTVGLFRIISTQCSRSEKEKRKSMAQVLQNLNEYRTAKVDQFSAYKTAKLDQLSAFKNAKVGKLRTYKQATLQSVLQHMQTLQEHYTSQIGKVKDNCSQQVEKLRESYNNQASKFKLYKSSQVGRLKGYKAEKLDKLREHYNHQALKIKDYGSQQMTKLREQYKLQQQHLLKLLELLDIGNCMNAIEAECMRTDSMIFNDDLLNLEFDAPPAHVVIHMSDPETEDSEYVTATSHSDISHTINMTDSNSELNDDHLQRRHRHTAKRRKKRKTKTNSQHIEHSDNESEQSSIISCRNGTTLSSNQNISIESLPESFIVSNDGELHPRASSSNGSGEEMAV